MKILVINGHPDKESYCQAIFQTIVENIDSKHHEVEVINLNEENFDPVLRYGYRKRMEEDSFILRSQELIQWQIISYLFIPSGGVVCRAF